MSATEIRSLNGYKLNDETARSNIEKLKTESQQYTDTKISQLINSAPTTLDTLGEIAAAMAENATVVEALDAAIGSKADKNYVDEAIANFPVGEPDWNASEWEDGYIKNRTHYEDYVYYTTVLNDNYYTFHKDVDEWGNNILRFTQDGYHGLRSEYIKVRYDFKDYKVKRENDEYVFYNSKGEMIVIKAENQQRLHFLIYYNGPLENDTYTSRCSIHNLELEIHQLDEKFIPSDIARVSQLEDFATESYVDEKIETIEIPVDSVNGKTGEVTLTTSDIGAMNANNPVGTGSFSMGRKENSVIGYCSYAMGDQVIANGQYSHAEGNEAKAIGDYSHAEGYVTIAYGKGSHAEGSSTTVSKLILTGEANATNYICSSPISTGYLGHIIYYNNSFFKIVNIDTNNKILTLDKTLSSEPITNIEMDLRRAAIGMYSHTEGQSTNAIGNYSHAEGNATDANGNYSHAEGYFTQANKEYSHAEGQSSTANGIGSHAEGRQTQANGDYSHAEGYTTKAIGNYSHAEGYHTRSSSEYQHTQGQYNIVDSANKYAHIVGNGSSYGNLSNAHTLDWDGNAWFAGDVYVGSTSGTNKDEGSKKLVTEDHTQAASTITAGTFGGTVAAKGDSQAPNTFLLRNSKLVATETTPTVNGEICWLYE